MNKFCSDYSLKTEISICWTATYGAAFLFYPLKKSLWGSDMGSSVINNSDKNFIKQLTSNWINLRFYDDAKDMNIYLYNRNISFIGGIIEDSIEKSYFSLVNWVPKKPENIYFICTHGQRDQCCAKYGFWVFLELKKRGFRVKQCSHLGGDRFSATLISFPDGNAYGYLRNNESLDTVFSSIFNGNLSIKNYRWNSFLTPQEQLIFQKCNKELKIKNINEFKEQVKICTVINNKVTANLNGFIHEFNFDSEDIQSYGDCERIVRGKLNKFTKLKLIS